MSALIRPERFGKELGYAERTTSFTTTNTVTATPDVITGMSVTVIGTGRPVQVEFYGAGFRHTVALTLVLGTLMINGVLGPTVAVTPGQAAVSNTAHLTSRRILIAGTSYTFEVGMSLGAAGTGTVTGSAVNPMFIAVTGR